MNKEDGYITKAEYIRRMQWNDDILSVIDSIKFEMMGKMEEMITDHFDADMSDFREYMHDKIKWEQMQRAALPKWIAVSERLPECEVGAEIGNVEWIRHGMVFAGCFGRGGKYRDAYFRTWADATEGIDAKDVDCWRVVTISVPSKEDLCTL